MGNDNQIQITVPTSGSLDLGAKNNNPININGLFRQGLFQGLNNSPYFSFIHSINSRD